MKAPFPPREARVVLGMAPLPASLYLSNNHNLLVLELALDERDHVLAIHCNIAATHLIRLLRGCLLHQPISEGIASAIVTLPERYRSSLTDGLLLSLRNALDQHRLHCSQRRRLTH